MDFFIDLENFLLKKRVPVKHFILICILLLFSFFSIVIGAAEGNYYSIISILVAGFLCLLFSRETRKMHDHNHVIAYQKSIATAGFDASLFAFFIFSRNGKCVFINRVAQNLFPGLKIRTIEDFIFSFGKYPKVVEAIRSLQVVAENMRQSHVDVPIKLLADKLALWRIAIAPIPEHNGFTGWTIMDLTPSTSKIESLETNSIFLLNIINNSTVGYFCLNEDDEIAFCNKIFSSWLKETEDILDSPFSRYVIKGKSENLPNGDSSGKLTGSLPARITLRSSDESEIEVIVKHILQQDDGNRVYLATRDLQQKDDIVQALGKTKLYFEYIFEDAPVGIAITTGAETISASNRTFQKIAGRSSENSTSFLDYVLEEERGFVGEKLYNLLADIHKSITPFEIHFRAQERNTIMVYVTKIDEAERTKDNDGLVMYFIDITERKELQQQFVQSQKMQAVGQLAGGVAHDFNNLLTAMIGYCDLLLEKYLPSDQSFSDVMQIKQNANRASNLVRQLLAFSRQQTLQPKIAGVMDMLNELSALLKRLLGANIELKVTHGKNIGFIKVDQIQFEQVIINLAVNARDAMKEGGTLTIRTSFYSTLEAKFLHGGTMPPGDYVLIEVLDNGCGIEKKNLNRIFDPFFSSKEKGHGTGLGLSTVYGIVNQTGGFISVESEIGSGTKFSLYFPVIVPPEQLLDEAEGKSKENKVQDLTGEGTILLVEDEDAVRLFSTRALREKGYRVIESSSGEEALEIINKRTDNIDLIITDVVMPKMDGPTLVKHIRDHNLNIKVVFISGYTEDNFKGSLENDDLVHFLHKPFNLKELASKVKEVMGTTKSSSSSGLRT
ncbi:MAG: response regulator [Holosporaceae bacterium]|jgi:two-component system cell cycle sensor histidine kinase/response regulator CckA|nr:response regulator [Holosporaceae bacterium]